jgi:hypothetical protein
MSAELENRITNIRIADRAYGYFLLNTVSGGSCFLAAGRK